MGGARLIRGSIWLSLIGLDELIRQQKGLDFFAADIGQHAAVDFDAGAQHLAALFDHFLALRWIVDDVAILERKVVLAHDRSNPLAPATSWFQVGDDLRFIHNR